VSLTLTGLTQGINYKAKIRHIKSGITTDFTAEVDAYTLLPAPSFPSWSAQGVEIDLTISVAVVTATRLYIERASVPINDQAVSAIGNYYYNDLGLTINTNYAYRARIFSTNWPAAIQYSTFTNQTINSGSRL